MRRLSLAVLFVAVLFTGAHAHNGAISLYTDETITKCDAVLQLYEMFDLNIYYVKDQGPDLGRAVEFRVLVSTGSALLQPATWSPKIVFSLGDPETGISLTAMECIGPGETVSYIGTIPVMNVGDPDTFTVRVVKDPATLPAPSIRITGCDPENPLYEVLGGYFVFSGDPLHPGSCNPAVRSRTWGSIKSLYR
jgi:hypothetical protein